MKRRFTGAVLALAVAAGIYLGSKWKGPGLGGSGIGSGDGSAASTAPEGPIDPNVRVQAPAAPAGSATLTAPAANSPADLLVIVVHGDRYRLGTLDDPLRGKEVGLAKIRELAAAVPGNDLGLKVRILNARDAQEGARSDLYTALAEAGIKREEIQERSEFVD